MFRRIDHRHHTFWDAPDANEIVRFVLSARDPLEVWQTPRHWQRRLNNKYNAREFARLHGCRVPELYWRGGDVTELNWASLPAHYVIRPTFPVSAGSDVYVMSDGVNLLDGKMYARENLRSALIAARKANPAVEFLFEQFLRSETGQRGIQKDYKLYVFADEVACIQVIRRTGPGLGQARYYDVEWSQMPQVGGAYPQGPAEDPPACLDDMIAQARVLGQSYGIFVRIGFYATDEGAVFGEFTPTPGRDWGFTEYGDRLMVEYWDRFCPGMI
jgi:hypothetical protein